MKSLRFFITLAVGSVLAVVFLVSTARIWGLRQEYAAHTHPLLQKTPLPWVIALPTWVHSKPVAELERACKDNPSLCLAVNVFAAPNSADFSLQPLTVGAHADPLSPPTGGVDTESSPPTADLFFATLGKSCRWLISLNSNVTDVHTRFFTLADKMGLDANFAVRSPYDVVNFNLKELRPQGAYGSSVREITRLSMAEQLLLAPLINVPSDLILLNPYFRGRWVLQESLLSEIQRRQKHLCVGPLDDFARWKELRKLGFDCVLTNDPKLYLQN